MTTKTHAHHGKSEGHTTHPKKSGRSSDIKFLPKTEEGWMQLEYFLIGVIISTFIAFAFLMGMKVGYQYGINACL